MSRKQKPLKLSRRLVNTKRHTTGYVIGGRKTSVAQARKFAQQGRLSGVRVVGDHIQAQPGRKRLSDLPVTIE